MRKLLLNIIIIFALIGCKTTDEFVISGKLVFCEKQKHLFENKIYLSYKNQLIDSANTEYRHLFSFPVNSKRFKFKNLKPGNYIINYFPVFKF
ncbi:MAG: hypothetical protein DRJ10_21305, partial [Bacteroidetes bacterium]